LEFFDEQSDLQGAAQAYAQGLIGERLRGPHFEDGVAQRIVLEEEWLHDHGVGAVDWQQPVRQGSTLDRGVAEPLNRYSVSPRIAGEDHARTRQGDALI